jgi:5-methylcytosine-specific restriction endonuclease McrA
MGAVATAARHLMAAGVTGDALIAALEEIENAAKPFRSVGAERTSRYRRRLGVSTAEWGELRRQVMERDDHCCQYCGDNGGQMHCDHVIPLAAGGPTTLDNLVAACASCNRSKKDRPVAEWEATR